MRPDVARHVERRDRPQAEATGRARNRPTARSVRGLRHRPRHLPPPAAIRTLCDWLVVHQVLPVNPAAAVRGPKHVVTKGATPVLTPAAARALPGPDRHGDAGRAVRSAAPGAGLCWR